MSMAAFGQRLGVSLDVISNIEHNRLARPEQKISLLKLICKEFSVNEEWLLNGTEPMFIRPDTFDLHDFAKEHNITELETEIVKTYLELDPDIRRMLVEHFKQHLMDRSGLKEGSVEHFEAEYKKKVLDSAQNTDSTVLNITKDIAKTVNK